MKQMIRIGNGELTDDCEWERRVNRLLEVGTES